MQNLNTNPESIQKIIRDFIEEQIVNGELKPGDKINQFALTKEFNVSMSTVRESLVALASDRLVHLIPRRGFFVNDIDEHDIKSIFQVRFKLEELVAELVVNNISNDDISYLKNLLKKMEVLAKEKNSDLYWKVDIKFHEYVYQLTSNEYLIQFINSLEKRIHYIRLKVLQNPDRLSKSWEYHSSLVNTFEQRDSKKAKLIINNNLKNVEKMFLNNGK